MPAQEETSSVTVLTWTLDTIDEARELQDAAFDLGLVCVLQRNPVAETPERQLQLQILLPTNRNGPIIVDSFGRKVRTVTMDGALVSIELLPTE